MNLVNQLSFAIKHELEVMAYSILSAIETGQANSTDDYLKFKNSDYIERNKVLIGDYIKRNTLQLGKVKLYAVPSVVNAPAVSLYFAENKKQVQHLHSKQVEYERGKSIIREASEWLLLEVEINQGDTKSLLELKNEAHTLPCYVGQLTEGLISSNGLPIDFMKARETA